MPENRDSPYCSTSQSKHGSIERTPTQACCATILRFTRARRRFFSTTLRGRRSTLKRTTTWGNDPQGFIHDWSASSTWTWKTRRGGDGGDSDNPDQDAPISTDEDPPAPWRPKPNRDPDSSEDDDGQGFRGPKHACMSMNKWANPVPKLDLPPRIHLQKASKIKQIWELWSMNVALAMSTWTDVAVTFWHQGYHQSESSYQYWRRSSMTEEWFAYEKCYLYGRKAPVPSTCDAVEPLLGMN